MTDINNPTQSNTESPSVESGAVNQQTEAEANAGIDALVADMFNLNDEDNLPPSEDPEVSEEATESEESAELEEQAEDADVDTPDEAEETEETDESGLEEGDLEIVSYDDLKGYALEIGGETYTPAQLKSMLGRMKAAGDDARKADQAVKELDAREAKLQEQEEWLKQRASAASQSDQLAEMQADARRINAKIEAAREEGDMYEVAVQKDKLDVLKSQYAQAQQQVSQVQQQAEAKQLESAEKGLRDRGLGYLLEDNPQAKAWTSYASSKLSEQELRAVTMIPALAEAVEKARKYDASQKKGVKLKSSGKTLKPGVNKPKTVNTATKKKAEYQANPETYFIDLANDILSS